MGKVKKGKTKTFKVKGAVSPALRAAEALGSPPSEDRPRVPPALETSPSTPLHASLAGEGLAAHPTPGRKSGMIASALNSVKSAFGFGGSADASSAPSHTSSRSGPAAKTARPSKSRAALPLSGSSRPFRHEGKTSVREKTLQPSLPPPKAAAPSFSVASRPSDAFPSSLEASGQRATRKTAGVRAPLETSTRKSPRVSGDSVPFPSKAPRKPSGPGASAPRSTKAFQPKLPGPTLKSRAEPEPSRRKAGNSADVRSSMRKTKRATSYRDEGYQSSAANPPVTSYSDVLSDTESRRSLLGGDSGSDSAADSYVAVPDPPQAFLGKSAGVAPGSAPLRAASRSSLGDLFGQPGFGSLPPEAYSALPDPLTAQSAAPAAPAASAAPAAYAQAQAMPELSARSARGAPTYDDMSLGEWNLGPAQQGLTGPPSYGEFEFDEEEFAENSAPAQPKALMASEASLPPVGRNVATTRLPSAPSPAPELLDWLSTIGLERYLSELTSVGVRTPQDMIGMEAQDLEAFSIPPWFRRKLLAAVSDLSAAAADAEDSLPSLETSTATPGEGTVVGTELAMPSTMQAGGGAAGGATVPSSSSNAPASPLPPSLAKTLKNEKAISNNDEHGDKTKGVPSSKSKDSSNPSSTGTAGPGEYIPDGTGEHLLDATSGAIVAKLPVAIPPEIPYISRSRLDLDSAPLGSGSFGVVFSATLDGSSFAVKVPNSPPPAEVLAHIRNTFRELQTQVSAGDHPNIVTLIGVSWEPPPPEVLEMIESPLGLARLEMPWIVMSHMSGGDLLNHILRVTRDGTSPLSPLEVATFAMQAAAGISHLHAHNVVHRDLACRNLLLDGDGVIHVADFGLAREISSPYAMGGTHNRQGPLRWEAPEAILSRIYSAKSDVYMFGCCMFEMVMSGREPWAEYQPVAAAMHVMSGYTLDTELRTDCHPKLREIMKKCWLPVAASRPSMKDVHGELSSLVAELSA